MALTYGTLKAALVADPVLQASRHGNETQYHLHATLEFTKGDAAPERWDCAINVGTNDSDDLLQYKLVYDFAHPIVATLRASSPGFNDLTVTAALPALDYLRSDVLRGTGPWRPSGVMDGSDAVEPTASLLRLLQQARASGAPVYVFGRAYTEGLGIHDVHMNQGSSGSFVNDGVDDHNDHNAVWQDGAVLVDLGAAPWAAYFTVFTQQCVPTDPLGNPEPDAHPVTMTDDGSLIGGSGAAPSGDLRAAAAPAG